jgi:hypothetical protein
MLFEKHCRNQCFTQRIIKTIYFFCAIGFYGVVPAYLLLENGSGKFAYRITIQIFPLQLFFCLYCFYINNCFGKAFQVTRMDKIFKNTNNQKLDPFINQPKLK